MVVLMGMQIVIVEVLVQLSGETAGGQDVGCTEMTEGLQLLIKIC